MSEIPLDPICNEIVALVGSFGVAAITDVTQVVQPAVIAIAGSVAVGKTVFATSLAAELEQRGLSIAVIGTDGFLLPNTQLQDRGLLDRKGFPESYDEPAMQAFAAAARSGQWPIPVRSYSHTSFDVVPASPVERVDVLLVEGINALREPLRSGADLAIYLDAPEPVVVEWFVERMLAMIELAEKSPGGFYDRFLPWDHDQRDAFARKVWTDINGPNFHEFIRPTRAAAHWIVSFDADHSVLNLART